MKLAILLFYVLAFTICLKNADCQSYRITGKILDAKTNKPLPYAFVKVDGSNSGATSDGSGNFILRTKSGSVNLITSYIGYFSDTSSFYITDSDQNRDIFLKPSEIFTETIEVAGEDPAYGIIRKAIMYKRNFKKDLKEYNYDAYTKFVLRSSINPFSDEKSVTDSTGMSILGILESETSGYIKEPGLEKQIVRSKRETANISRGFAIPYVVNFYDEAIDLGETKIPGPLCDDAFDYYEYKLTGTTSLDSSVVYKIKVINTSSVRPQFKGTVYIIDSIYALTKVELETNGEVMQNISSLKFLQKFSSYKDRTNTHFRMPNDVQIFAEGSFAGLIRFKAEVFSIISDYALNEKAPAGLFDDIIVKVNKDADKDSVYWQKNKLIENSEEEKSAYKNIQRTTSERANKLRFGGLSMNIGRNFSMSLMDLYSFNSIEGSRIGTSIKFNKDFGRINSSLFYGYGFADKKAKYKFDFETRLLEDRSLRISAESFKRLNSPFMKRGWEEEFVNTYYTLFDKNERYYYFYESGFSFSIFKSVIPQAGLKAVYFESKQTSANVNADFSFFRKDAKYSANPKISDAFKRSLSLALQLDFNKYRGIDWGTGEITRFPVTEFPSLSFSLENSSKNLGSTFDFRKYKVELSGENKLTYRIKPKYLIGFQYLNGNPAFQDLPYFNVYYGSGKMLFGTMNYGEFTGDKLFYFNFENDFGKFFPQSIPVLKSINLIGLFNAGRSFINDKLLQLISDKNMRTTDGVFLETGFALGNILDAFRLDFCWRLNNYKTGSNFNFFLNYSF